uniref:Cysteine and serine rich nuclear protein 2 n=1 Tax=Serinus canaria TaxID=9135 RepID=A0A8C9KWI0_SERCA
MAAVPSAGIKRKPEDAVSGLGSGSAASSGATSDDEIATSDSGDSCDSGGSTGSAAPPSILRRSRARRGGKRVRFAQVTVYYFARRQGFTCVPSAGGSSLGMAPRHHRARRYSLSQFAHLRQVSHRQHLRQHLRREKLPVQILKPFPLPPSQLTQNGTVPSAEAAGLTLADVSDDDLDVGQVEVGDYFYLQPLPTKRRRALLRASGVRRIDVWILQTYLVLPALPWIGFHGKPTCALDLPGICLGVKLLISGAFPFFGFSQVRSAWQEAGEGESWDVGLCPRDLLT